MSTSTRTPAFYSRIREIIESARAGVARTVNTIQVIANWLIGREIVEAQQKGKRRADYGRNLLADLSVRMTKEFGRGYSVDNLEWFRLFYLSYPDLLGAEKSDAPRRILPLSRDMQTFSTNCDQPWDRGLLTAAYPIPPFLAQVVREIKDKQTAWTILSRAVREITHTSKAPFLRQAAAEIPLSHHLLILNRLPTAPQLAEVIHAAFSESRKIGHI